MINFDLINADLDTLSDMIFNSEIDAWNAISLKLENYDINIPDIKDDFSDEMFFRFDNNDNDDRYFYVNFDNEENGVIVYATFLNQEELEIIENLD